MDKGKKIYCCDCKFIDFHGSDDYARCVASQIPWSDGIRKYKTNGEYCLEKNKQNDCQDYKRKWWRWWA